MTISNLVLVSVGNTRTRVARCRPWEGAHGAMDPSRVLDNADPSAVIAAVEEAASVTPADRTRLLLAAVNAPLADRLINDLAGRAPQVTRLVSAGGSGLVVPIQHELPAPVTVGVDRLLAALGAAARSGEACVVIDAGTAVTVDFVDGFGVYRGGVIAPGLAMQLRALHERTAALPEVQPPRTGGEALPTGALGRTTRDAMLLGCCRSVQGLVRLMIDKVAEEHGSYPRVLATGGDAPLLFEHDELVEHIVPDLVPMGMMAAWRTVHAGEGDEDA
ncbi:MAG: type III pantothenate kinase [Phycisphaerae bacterium]|nr:type III pantothenate kinase [Phycisphaerae bacterium]